MHRSPVQHKALQIPALQLHQLNFHASFVLPLVSPSATHLQLASGGRAARTPHDNAEPAPSMQCIRDSTFTT
jgi:hypothetical protein